MARKYGREEGGSVELNILGIEKIETGPVVDSEAHRLFLVGWDVPAFCARLPVPSGVRR